MTEAAVGILIGESGAGSVYHVDVHFLPTPPERLR